MNPITRTLNVDNLLLLALQEDISSEDVTTNAVMPEACQGTVQLLCKQDGVLRYGSICKSIYSAR